MDKDPSDRPPVPPFKPQQHQDHPRRSPQNVARPGNKRRRNNQGRGGRGGKSQIRTDLGFLGSVPSLQDLQRENRKRTRRHYVSQQYRDGHRKLQTKGRMDFVSLRGPPSAPGPAQFPGADANPLETPTIAMPAAGDIATADKLQAIGLGLQADLDFYATNEGLVFYNNTPMPSSSDGEIDSRSLSAVDTSDSAEQEDDPGRADVLEGGLLALNSQGTRGNLAGRILHRLRGRVTEQDAYIAELEDDNLRLRERIELLQKQLKNSMPRKSRNDAALIEEPGDAEAAHQVVKEDEAVDNASEMKPE